MTLPTVTLIPGTETPIGAGVNRPTRCLVRFPDQSIRRVVLKRLPIECVAAEAFCALLLRGWGLKVPEPAIVSEQPPAFASLDLDYPNLLRRIGWSQQLPPIVQHTLTIQGAQLLSGFADTPRALAADEAIDNRDRNLGNVLWNGQDVAWVDHERALGVVPMPDVNLIAHLVQAVGAADGVQRAAVAISLTLTSQAGLLADVQQHCEQFANAPAFASVVATRLTNLATRVLDRFPQPPLFANQQQQGAV